MPTEQSADVLHQDLTFDAPAMGVVDIPAASDEFLDFVGV
jgi:hypothetical protein